MLDLSADPADEPITQRREAAERNGGTILNTAIGLRKWSEDDVAFIHLRRPAAVHSGSLSGSGLLVYGFGRDRGGSTRSPSALASLPCRPSKVKKASGSRRSAAAT